MSGDVSAFERLAAVEAIRCVKARYFRGLDTRDWELLGSAFTQDAIFDTREALGAAKPGEDSHDPFRDEGYLVGRDVIVRTLSTLGSSATYMVHHGHMPEIEVKSAARASAVWAMDDRVEWPEGAPLRSLRGFGHYHDEYSCIDGEWLISFSRLTRLHVRAR